jgi:glycosyltransferase involved in cell wall biosynthesis
MPASETTKPKRRSPPSDGPGTFYVVTGAVDCYWRCTAPAEVIGARVVQIPGDAATDLLVRHPHQVYEGHVGAGVWTRPDTVRARHAVFFEEHGIPTVAEMDDNYLSTARLNLFMRENRVTVDDQRRHLKAMAVFQRNIFSTDWLRDRYRKAFKELGHVPELFVCRNHVNLTDWPEPIPSDRLRVGWMGSAQHARDIKLVADAMTWAKGQGHRVVHMGHDPRASDGVTDPVALDACFAWSVILTDQIPWVDPEEYHRTALPIDIGLCPLERNDHTLGKSDVKWLEYTMSGAATIASSGTVYRDIVHGETGILAGSPDEFTYWTKELCRNHALREELVANAREHVCANRTLQVQGKEEWGAALAD